MAPVKSLLSFFSFLVLLADTVGTTMIYDRLMNNLGRDLNPAVIPITEDRRPVKVKVRMSLLSILDVDEERDEVEIIAWNTMSWKHPALVWDPSDYNNVTHVRVPAEYMWIPDITAYNAASPAQVMTPDLTVVNHDGVVHYIPSIRLRFMCRVAGVDTASGAKCTIKLGSWTYSGDLLTVDPDVEFELTEYIGSSRYEILSTSAQKQMTYFTCCPEPYEDLMFSFVFKYANAGGSWFY